MESSKQDFIPILVGGDINTYSMARTFHEAYGIKSVVVGRMPLPIIRLSSIIEEIIIDEDLLNTKSFVDALKKVAKKFEHRKAKLLLVGTNDFYVRLIIENSIALRDFFTFNYINEELMNNLLVKANFYRLCTKYPYIDIPKTYFFSCKDASCVIPDITYPAIVKPSDGIQHLKNPFEGQKKVYKVNNKNELTKVISDIKGSGYLEDLIIQDYIPGDDTAMWDSVFYCDHTGKAQLISFAQVVLQEHTPTAIGNYTALISRFNEEMMMKLKKFLEELGYVGFANFDIKYDSRDNKFKVFEVNIRQGRSSFYVTACGHNLAKYLVDDIIYNIKHELTLVREHILFSVVPMAVIKTAVTNKDIQREAIRLLNDGHFVNPLYYKKDTGWKRSLYLFLRSINYIVKYKRHTW
ncbi:MAG: carboxylate--amine ligase [Candidatus Pacebacteria bacterium]|nr:carboxylate--amine ligase [Candidatus Paceibacterota bacterium]